MDQRPHLVAARKIPAQPRTRASATGEIGVHAGLQSPAASVLYHVHFADWPRVKSKLDGLRPRDHVSLAARPVDGPGQAFGRHAVRIVVRAEAATTVVGCGYVAGIVLFTRLPPVRRTYSIGQIPLVPGR